MVDYVGHSKGADPGYTSSITNQLQFFNAQIAQSDHQVVRHASRSGEPVNVDDRALQHVTESFYGAGVDLVCRLKSRDIEGHFFQV